jgi:hypothetical protein
VKFQNRPRWTIDKTAATDTIGEAQEPQPRRSVHVRVSIALFLSYTIWHGNPAHSYFKEHCTESTFSDGVGYSIARSPESAA